MKSFLVFKSQEAICSSSASLETSILPPVLTGITGIILISAFGEEQQLQHI